MINTTPHLFLYIPQILLYYLPAHPPHMAMFVTFYSLGASHDPTNLSLPRRTRQLALSPSVYLLTNDIAHSLPASVFLCLFISVFLCVYYCLCLSLPLSLFLSLFVSLFVSTSIFAFLFAVSCLCLFSSLYLSLHFPVSVPASPYVFLCIYSYGLSLFLPIPPLYSSLARWRDSAVTKPPCCGHTLE